MNEARNGSTSRTAQDDAAVRYERYKKHLDERLDEALEETFPASDPIAITPPRGMQRARN